jgi:hypothetical protein
MTREHPTHFDAATAARFAGIALSNIACDYPHKLDHVIDGDGDVVAPCDVHPAFHGSFDWHSCVHMHWLLVRILRGFPSLPARASIEAALDRNLGRRVAVEVAYAAPSSTAFERPYGWAWLLKLATELGCCAGRARWSNACSHSPIRSQRASGISAARAYPTPRRAFEQRLRARAGNRLRASQ